MHNIGDKKARDGDESMGEINGTAEKKVVCIPHRLPMSVNAADGMSCTLNAEVHEIG